MPEFRIQTEFELTGDQPRAVEDLCRNLAAGKEQQTLLGVTGSGKTFTIAQVIQRMQRPALVIAPNKTLAGQLYSEFLELFPHNAVGYFVSYYDYYQPEAYVAATDTYIAKDSAINEQIDRLRHQATHDLLVRRDIVVVASVSCIYGIGSPDAYTEMSVSIEVDEDADRDELIRRLVTMQYVRNDFSPRRGSFRARGDVIEIFPAWSEDKVYRVELFGDTVEAILEIDGLTGEILGELPSLLIHPASHYVTPKAMLERAIRSIEEEKVPCVENFKKQGKLIEAQRLEMRTNLDLELLEQIGTCSGIENYSRHLDGRQPGEPPATLLDYFPDDFITFIDESHVTLPQIGGMLKGDRSRKTNLVKHGFRLPSALDNRPLSGEEFELKRRQVIYVSATPGDVELERSGGVDAELVIRPTGLLDPVVEIRPATGQVDDLLGEIRTHVGKGGRVLVTSLTKRMAEDLTEYYRELDLRVRYLHSDIDTLERHAIIRSLRLGEFDVLVGINLLREGLDLPEVTLVAVLDADKEGFLRSRRSLIQTMGRAARNVDGKVILYADKETDSIRAAVSETRRRRALQEEYNRTHGITPKTVKKRIAELLGSVLEKDYVSVDLDDENEVLEPQERDRLPEIIQELEARMRKHAEDLEYEKAAELRDRIRRLEKRFLEVP
ncbi:MAG TPA: excinuclease ABC subunit UvrB [Planctomycetes bacterium]|nr:excinuclease ABC subunit UvrB [Planctomycetota bacterium]